MMIKSLKIEELQEFLKSLCEDYDKEYGPYPENFYEGKSLYEFFCQRNNLASDTSTWLKEDAEPLGIVVCGFPGVGKSYLVSNNTKYKISDSDSSQFDNPKDYVDHIIQKRKEFDIVLVSTHEDVRAELRKRNILYQVVFPHQGCKSEYLERYKNRGNTKQFIDLIDKNWDKWVNGCLYDGCYSISLKSGCYISDVVDSIIYCWKRYTNRYNIN